MNGAVPAWTILLALVHLVVGVLLGVVYFRSLWWSACLLASGSPVRTAASMAGRLTLLAGVLALTSFEGAAPLLATGVGVLAGRAIVMRRVREAAP